MIRRYTLPEMGSIGEEGVIRPPPRKPRRPERAVAWLSINDHYEYTAMKLGISRSGEQKMLSLSEMDAHCGGVYRMSFEALDLAGLLHWSELWKASEMGYEMARRLERRAIECGANPDDWWGSLKVIPIGNRPTIERFNVETMAWQPVGRADVFLQTAFAGEGVLQVAATGSGLVVPTGAFRPGASW